MVDDDASPLEMEDPILEELLLHLVTYSYCVSGGLLVCQTDHLIGVGNHIFVAENDEQVFRAVYILVLNACEE